MNRKVVRPIILVLVFIGAIVTFSIAINKENKNLTTTMAETTLPVLNFVFENTKINELHGYVNEMDLGTMRDAVTPIESDNELHIEIKPYEKEIDTISFEIRSIEDNRLLIDNDNVERVERGDRLSCDIKLPELFENNKEYNMIIWLTSGEEKLYYYTRIMKQTDCNVEESVSFALQFHEYTFRDDAENFIPTYMDPATGDATTLSYVDLSCTLRQITWADFEGTRLTEPIVAIEEINSSYNALILTYVMTNVNDNNEVEYYNVEEFYRLRKASNRMYVLNFERRMNQIFRVENNFIRNDSEIVLGIRNPEVEYVANDAGDSIAFVQEGELWSYNRSNNTISQVFSFRSLEGINVKENWNQHDIHIIKVDEAGSVDFVVYGYMNRGSHEGQVGIGVYHYDGIAQTIEEEIFISSKKSYDALKAELGELMYINEQKIFYLMMNEKVYKIDLTTYEVTTMLENVKKENYAVSESSRFFAWIRNEESYNSTLIHLEDLKTGITYEVKEGEGTYLRPLDFLGEDFIYGIAKAENVKIDNTGNMFFPMSSLKIMNTYEEQKEIIKTYSAISGLIEEITVNGENIYVSLINEKDGRFVSDGEDIIMNRETEKSSEVEIATMVTEEKQRQILLTMKTLTTNEALSASTSKHILIEGEREVISLDTFEHTIYYVYARGKSLFASQDVSEAILVANDNLGVVVDQNRNYIWKRARATNRSAFRNIAYNEADASGGTIAKCISAILTREGKALSVNELLLTNHSPKEILQSSIQDAIVLELNGCTTDEILYFIDRGNPVMAYVENGEAILLIGYSSTQIHYYDPATGVSGSLNMEEADARFVLGGNRFVAYVK